MIGFKGLTFNTNFRQNTQEHFDRKQKYVDSEVLRFSDPYVPFRTGMLKKSGISGTVLGSGVVEYTAPYARQQYYTNAGRGIEGTNASGGISGKRGKFWFERMKLAHKNEILNGLKQIK